MYQNAQRTCRAIVFAYKIESNCEVLVVAVVVPLRSKPRTFLHEKKNSGLVRLSAKFFK